MANYTFSVTIVTPNFNLTEMIRLISARYNYLEILDDGTSNPESRSQFVKRKVGEYIKQLLLDQFQKESIISAVQVSQTQINGLNITIS